MENPLLRGRELNAQQKRLYDTLLFLVRLAALSLPVYAVISSGFSLYPLQVAAASQSEQVLLFMGMQVSRNGAEMNADGFRFFISEDCTGWKSMLFITALVLSVPAVAWNKKLAGILAGVPVVWLANIVRIVSVVIVQKSSGLRAAMLFHDLFWQFFLAGVVLAAWVAWFLFAARPETGRALFRKAGKLI